MSYERKIANMEIHEILKNEVIKDYFTANVKAEVLIDTILTPVIAEILTVIMKEPDSGNTEQPSPAKADSGYKVRLLAKEFPLPVGELPSLEEESPAHGKNLSYRSCNVDYLMYDNECVYYVELKTTWSSFEPGQMNRYLERRECEKSFGSKEGSDFIRLLNHVSKTGKSELEGGMPEVKLEKLRELFWGIVDYNNKDKKERVTDRVIWDSYSSLAKKYLIEEKADSSKKYLFTAGQILDHKGDGKWWDYKKRKLIYIGPESEEIDARGDSYQIGYKEHQTDLNNDDRQKYLLPKEYGRIVTFQDIIDKADDIRSGITDSELGKYWEWVVKVLEEIPNKGKMKRDS